MAAKNLTLLNLVILKEEYVYTAAAAANCSIRILLWKKMKQYCNNLETDLNFTHAYIEPGLLFANSKILNLGLEEIPQVTLFSGDPEQSVQFTVKYIIHFKMY